MYMGLEAKQSVVRVNAVWSETGARRILHFVRGYTQANLLAGKLYCWMMIFFIQGGVCFQECFRLFSLEAWNRNSQLLFSIFQYSLSIEFFRTPQKEIRRHYFSTDDTVFFYLLHGLDSGM